MAPSEDMFGPPIARGMTRLDRSIFRKTVSLKAARILDNKNIAGIRSQLERSQDGLRQDRIANVRSDPHPEQGQSGKKCILLRPEIRYGTKADGNLPPTNADQAHHESTDGPSTPWPHSSTLMALVQQNLVSVVPFQLDLDYDYWTYHDIISAILPPDAQDEIPSGFSQVGHVAHLNLRDQYLPYKGLIAEIILDKNPNVRTVINKIDDVGHENEFRTFNYEVLAGPDDMNVTVSEASCIFKFDYSKRGEAVCDVMAGIGPFAVPAGKKDVFVWANDLNPDSYASLIDAVARNKVEEFVKASNTDGRDYIRLAAMELLHSERIVEFKKKSSRKVAETPPKVVETLSQPRTFQHYVLNLPASALTFLPSFIGLYPPGLRDLIPEGTRMPLIHVYCFGVKDELELRQNGNGIAAHSAKIGAVEAICAEVSRQLQYEMRPGSSNEDDCIEVYDVRDVAPKKRMFCATFRLPEVVAFRDQ